MKENNIKTLLICLISLSYGGTIAAVILTFLNDTKGAFKTLLILLVYLVAGIFSGKYLKNKNKTNNNNWYLFGLWASLNALIYYWFWKVFSERWGKRKSISTP